MLGNRFLGFHGGSHGVHDALELRQHAVAHQLDNPPVVFSDLGIDEVRAQGFEGRDRALLVSPDQP